MERKSFKCERCGHTWLSAKDPPKYCAKCKSSLWDKPRVVKPQ